MDADWKRLDRHGLSSEPGQPVLMAPTVNKLDEYADRIEELEAKLAKAVEALMRLSTAQCFGNGEVLGQHLPDTPMGRELVARMNFARATLAELKGEADG